MDLQLFEQLLDLAKKHKLKSLKVGAFSGFGEVSLEFSPNFDEPGFASDEKPKNPTSDSDDLALFWSAT